MLLFISLLLSTSSSLAQDYPQFLGPTRNAITTTSQPLQPFPPTGPKQLWKKEIGHGFSSPVIAEGKLILFHRIADNEVVQCLNPTTGEQIWSAQYPTRYEDDFGFDPGPRGTPAISNSRVYTHGADGMLNCWQLADGKNLWRVDTRKLYSSAKGFFGSACSPLVEGNAVILNLGGKQAGIVAFDSATGKELWHATQDDAGYSSPIAPTFTGKRYILSFTRAGLAVLDPATGKLFFHFPFRSSMDASVNAATPLVVGDEIFLSASYGTGAILLKFNPSAPTKIWSGDDILSNHYATSVYHAGFLYGFDGRQEEGPNLRCVEWKTGKIRWSQDHFGAGTLLLANDRLLILTEKGELLLARPTPDKFDVISRAQVLGFDTRAYPALADGLFFSRDKSHLICLDLRPR
jgi:outer membrane protein assembly factor BamB